MALCGAVLSNEAFVQIHVCNSESMKRRYYRFTLAFAINEFCTLKKFRPQLGSEDIGHSVCVDSLYLWLGSHSARRSQLLNGCILLPRWLSL
ncbi:hypothetical protein P9303_05881 [Prochlorococcus marinus str. MIT 9303]|uniref:Uncharacterized protein n=1 Tax=Prochlorococcus marinus (strain MIT 9303) TaxID=59922 RepID=A2C780_PROM3|nr:hypothetical protein P9303_05881 [Prochlorococcus marinus str. MIT 9303]